MVRIMGVSAVLGGPGCAEVEDDARAAFIQDVLVDDNRLWLVRDAPKVADKFVTMADDPYDFMRGSAALHFADLARPVSGRATTRFLNYPAATTVLIFGDPHPENATVCRPDPTEAEPDPPLSVEFVDLDAAGYGPWTLDLRRAALGLAVMHSELPDCAADCWEDTVRALARGYVSGLEPSAVVSVPRAKAEDTEAWGEFFVDLFEEAIEEGEEQKKTDKYAPLDEAGIDRAFVLGEETRLYALTPDEQRILATLVERMPLPTDFRLLAATRRLGSGVSSTPALRYVLLYDLGDDGPADDALMQMREVIDPPVFPGRPVAGLGAFADNHSRVERTAAQLWSRPDADPLHKGALVDGLSWKAVSWTSWFQDVDHTKVAEDWVDDKLALEDLLRLSEDLGRVLAASHARAPTRDGMTGRSVILDDLDGGGGALVLEDELVAHARTDLDQLHVDHDLFVRLLDSEGPLLGAERLADGVVP